MMTVNYDPDDLEPMPLNPSNDAPPAVAPVAAKHGALTVSGVARTRSERAILKAVAFWYPKAKTFRGGHRWMVKSAEEFRKEGAEYQPDTIWRAVRALVKRKVLVTERHYHPYKLIYGPVFWIRPVKPIIDDTKVAKKKNALASSPKIAE